MTPDRPLIPFLHSNTVATAARSDRHKTGGKEGNSQARPGQQQQGLFILFAWKLRPRVWGLLPG
ncbi:hypothetical protein F5144DRAFT_575693 [Chaetomium tenue]|uniref:Uncharacterized protein n=1 Tax=Chaetomium tenue TaxID=1854479 RepID=A0ACB7P5Y8_9PEZI|nr:hypothetical protein F5144DRAFT_575693 [Chaetomium globosum]